jgi:VIT1/CCC1 family predicted Fe2+/Mn2+ transporter
MRRAGIKSMTQPINQDEEQKRAFARRLNWLRAGVLGANDGIVSTAGIVMGVAGATTESGPILIAGVAALVAGSISMAGGEYASVSAQRDSEIAALNKQRSNSNISTQSASPAHDEEYVSPIAAAVASFIAFALGSVLPIVAIAGPWVQYREGATVLSVVLALALTGYFGAKIGGAKPLRAVLRNVVVSLLAMGIAFGIGTALGVAVG